jgi:DNA polymerase/3'-5' exonuclease PolX
MVSKSTRPMTNDEALQIASEFMGLVDGTCSKIAVAGSTRRGKAMVNDVEIVAMPNGNALWDKLDSMVQKVVITKALYGDSSPTPRWNGKKHRGMIYKNRRIEVFCADENNWGYIYWLRTGPDNDTDRANTMVATQLKWANPYGIRLSEGVISWGSRQLSIPDEHAWFQLLGLDFIPPNKRTTTAYAALNNPKHQWGDPVPFLMPILQPKLF